MIGFAIVACEIGFWCVLLAGMVLRYPLKMPRAGAVVLACVVLVDVALLAFTAVDLGRGASFHSTHGLAAAYLGFSVAFGHRLVQWADVRFAHRFAGGPAPAPKPSRGSAAYRKELWREWCRVVLAAGVASSALGLLALVAGVGQRGEIGDYALGIWAVVGLWLVAGPAWPSSTSAGSGLRPGER